MKKKHTHMKVDTYAHTHTHTDTHTFSVSQNPACHQRSRNDCCEMREKRGNWHSVNSAELKVKWEEACVCVWRVSWTS